MCRKLLIFLALVLPEVTSWTIDLPEARKFLFEKNDRLEKKTKERGYEDRKQVFFSNRFDSNSKHHENTYRDDDDEYGAYAKGYGYQSYMEKKVRDIVYDGSEYLEGLERSIERFSQLLENCTRMNRTNEYYFNETAFNATAFNLTSYNSTPPTATPTPWGPANERAPYNETSYLMTEERCRRVTRLSEYVRRLASLALKATKELQDIAYSRKYLKEDPKELSKQENEQILKLAWFLDRLAYYTGYRPQPRRYFNDDYSKSTTPLPPLVSMLNASEGTTRMMMNCLKQKSKVPATIRCAYPQEIPTIVQSLINNSNPIPPGTPSSSNRQERFIPPEPATSAQELLIATDHRARYLPYHHLTAVTHVRKRSVTEPHEMSKKMAANPNELSTARAEDPAITFMKYFVKHKIWEHDNPSKSKYVKNSNFETFEVNNQIPHKIQKRAADGKKPEDPFQDLSKYVKNKKGVHLVKDEILALKIRDYIQKIKDTKPSTPKEHPRRISKLFRYKRSNDGDDSKKFRSKLTNGNSKSFRPKRPYTYETDVDKPRDPEDLFKDISYYVKNKPGTNYNRDFVQAAQVRAGLLQIFLNPNIETVRRYGANFNPLVPDPLMFGALRSAADN